MAGDTAGLTVFFALFIMMVLAGTIWHVVYIRRVVRRKREITGLKRMGHRVTARVVKVYRRFLENPWEMYPDRSSVAWYVEAEWTDLQTGILHQFRSEPLHRRQAKLYTIGELISVLVDPTDPNRYYVERAH